MFHRRRNVAPHTVDTSASIQPDGPVVVPPRPPGKGGDRRQQALAAFGEERGDPHAFAVISNTVHFHPDPGLGGFGILVLTVPSDRRDPGVYLFDRSRAEWMRAYLLDDLPMGKWVQISTWDGSPVPVQLQRFSEDDVAARWIGRSGASVPYREWDLTGGPSDADMKLAASDHQAAMSRRFN